MSDLEKAIERIESDFRLLEEEPDEYTALVIDAARRFASLTSPETIEKAAKALQRQTQVARFESGWVSEAEYWQELAEAVLRSVEEDDDVSAK